MKRSSEDTTNKFCICLHWAVYRMYTSYYYFLPYCFGIDYLSHSYASCILHCPSTSKLCWVKCRIHTQLTHPSHLLKAQFSGKVRSCFVKVHYGIIVEQSGPQVYLRGRCIQCLWVLLLSFAVLQLCVWNADRRRVHTQSSLSVFTMVSIAVLSSLHSSIVFLSWNSPIFTRFHLSIG